MKQGETENIAEFIARADALAKELPRLESWRQYGSDARNSWPGT